MSNLTLIPTATPTTNPNNNFNNLITDLIDRANRARRLLSSPNRKCSNCSHAGHDRRSCPFNHEEAALLRQYHQNEQRTIQHELRMQYEHRMSRLQPLINAIRTKPPPLVNCHSLSFKMVENFKEGYYLTDGDTDPTEEISCCVCLENTKLNSMVAFQCGHGCCSGCAVICLKKISKNCPMCRKNIEEIRICRDIPLETFNTFQTFIKL